MCRCLRSECYVCSQIMLKFVSKTKRRGHKENANSSLFPHVYSMIDFRSPNLQVGSNFERVWGNWSSSVRPQCWVVLTLWLAQSAYKYVELEIFQKSSHSSKQQFHPLLVVRLCVVTPFPIAQVSVRCWPVERTLTESGQVENIRPTLGTLVCTLKCAWDSGVGSLE